MAASRISSRSFNQDVGAAKRAAHNGPVVITDRGAPTHVLLTYDAWQKLSGPRPSLLDALSAPGLSDPAFDPDPLRIGLRDAGFS